MTDPYPSSIELMNSQGHSMPTDSMGPDYSGSIPPPPGVSAVSMAPAPYEPMAAVPANQLGLPVSGRDAAKQACGLLCLAILGVIGGHLGRKGKSKKGAMKHIVSAGVGIASAKAIPVIASNNMLTSYGPKVVLAFGGGFVAGRWGK